MLKSLRGATALTLALLAAAAAGQPVHAADKPTGKPKPAVAAAKPPMGKLVVCNHSGYMFGVFADGATTTRTDDLAGSYDECTDWKPVPPGSYDLGLNLRVPSQQNVLINLRVKRDGHTIYRRMGNGTTSIKVSADRTTRVDVFIPRG